MKILKNKDICAGIRNRNGEYEFDYSKDDINDIVNLAGPELYQSNVGPNIYWFGYQFNDDVSSKDRTEFIHAIKELTPGISEDDLISFIDRPIFELDKVLSTYHIDAMVYPLSGRSPIVTKIVREINKYSSRGMDRVSFTLVKSAPYKISFDWQLFESDYSDDKNQYEQMKSYVENMLLPKIHEQGYFSLANSVKTKYRKYIKDFLNFSDSDIEKLQNLSEASDILVVDDINTSASTLEEILRNIRSLNTKSRIFIYTLIGR